MIDDTATVLDILLVEDNPADVRLTVEALKESQVGTRLHVVRDGEQALAFLRRQATWATAVRPDLILLDLNLPRKDGRAVLGEIKADQRLKTIPVVVLTTSEAEEDVHRAYELHANCYITKPVDLGEFLTVVRSVDAFWFSTVRLPHS